MVDPSHDFLPFSPGMGLKFLRDGVDSANVVSAVGYNGTPDDWNFFKHPLSNHMTGEKTMLIKAIERVISKVTDTT